jgi:hypothetical protein
MPNLKRKGAARPPRARAAKMYWLPMPRRQAELIVLQYRIALESLRSGRAGQSEAQCIAQAVLLTSMLTQIGYGQLEVTFIRETEEDVLAMLERGGETGAWHFPAAGLPRLIEVINEHDRQLREVRLAALIACNERLRGFTDSILSKPAAVR